MFENGMRDLPAESDTGAADPRVRSATTAVQVRNCMIAESLGFLEILGVNLGYTRSKS